MPRNALSYPERALDRLMREFEVAACLPAGEALKSHVRQIVRDSFYRIHRHGQREMRERIIGAIAMTPSRIDRIRALKVR